MDSNFPLACYPGIKCILSFLRRHFWWQFNQSEADAHACVVICTICAQGNSSHRPTTGLLCPLPIPVVHGLHIALYSITGLPPSQGDMVILRIVDCFSKAVHLWLSPVYPWPKRQQTSLPIIFSIYMASHWTQSQIEDPSSCPRYGKHFVQLLVLQSAYPLVLSSRPMVRLRQLTRAWRPPCCLLLSLMPPLGIPNWPGLSCP